MSRQIVIMCSSYNCCKLQKYDCWLLCSDFYNMAQQSTWHHINLDDVMQTLMSFDD